MADSSVAHRAAGGVALPRMATRPAAVSLGSPTRLHRRSSNGFAPRGRPPDRPPAAVVARTGGPRPVTKRAGDVPGSPVRDRRSCRPGLRRARVPTPFPAVRTLGGRRCRHAAAARGPLVRRVPCRSHLLRRSRAFLPATPTAPGTASRWPTVSVHRRTPVPIRRLRPVVVPSRVWCSSRPDPGRSNPRSPTRGHRVMSRSG